MLNKFSASLNPLKNLQVSQLYYSRKIFFQNGEKSTLAGIGKRK